MAATDGVPEGLLDNTFVVFGAVTMAWLSVQKGILHSLHGVRLGDSPLLATAQMVWLACGVLAVVGLTIAATQDGVPVVAAVIQAALAFFGAAGLHEAGDKLGKQSSAENAPASTG